MNEKYNVYARNRKHSRKTVLVGKELDIVRASLMVDAYHNRGIGWDSYFVNVEDDPGYAKA